MAVAVRTPDGAIRSADDWAKPWKQRIEQARRDRKRFEPNWLQSLAFASGKHWLKWSRTDRRLVLPNLPSDRERYTVDELSQYRYSALGELSQDEDRPELQFRKDDLRQQEYAKQANDALAYGWDNEWDGDRVLNDLRLKLIDLGTAAVRCRFDPTVGPVKANVPHHQGRPVLNPVDAYTLVDQGTTLAFRDIHEGRIRWEVASPFNLLVPPGIEHDRDFPWEIWERPVPTDKLKEEYGDKAASLKTDDSLGMVNTMGARELGDLRTGDPEQDTMSPGKLEGHVRVYTCYERPTRKHPKGQMVVLAGDGFTPLSITDELPYQKPDGTYSSGITYFHYQRVTGRFWARSLIDPAKDPQRMINKRRSQIAETIDRGQPKVFAEEGSLPQMDGRPAAYIRVKPGSPLPQVHPGIQPGPWMQQDVESLREDLQRSVGLHTVSLGENPAGVGNYSQLALLRENDARKLMPILSSFKDGIKSLVEDTVYDIRRYWGADKQIALAGDEGLLDAHSFNASELPPFFSVYVPAGAALPRTQAAKLKMIEEIYQAAINAQQPLPVSWLKESYEAGEALPLPEPPNDIHLEKAKLENSLLLHGAGEIQVADYDPIQVHVPEHRIAQVQAEMSGDAKAAAAVAAHIQAHLAQAQANTAAAAGQLGQPGQPDQLGQPGQLGQPDQGAALKAALAGVNAGPYHARFA